MAFFEICEVSPAKHTDTASNSEAAHSHMSAKLRRIHQHTAKFWPSIELPTTRLGNIRRILDLQSLACCQRALCQSSWMRSHCQRQMIKGQLSMKQNCWDMCARADF